MGGYSGRGTTAKEQLGKAPRGRLGLQPAAPPVWEEGDGHGTRLRRAGEALKVPARAVQGEPAV